MRPARLAPARDGRDAGLTLAELVVASSVGLIVLSMVGSIYLLALKTARGVVDATSVAAQGQAAMSEIEGGVRNAAVDGVHIGVGGDLLVVHSRAVGDSDTWECRAWSFVPDAGGAGSSYGSLYRTTAPLGTDLASVPDPRAAGWTVVVSGVRSNIFAWGEPGINGAGGARPGTTVHINVATAWRDDTVLGGIRGQFQRRAITPQPQDQKGDGGCFA